MPPSRALRRPIIVTLSTLDVDGGVGGLHHAREDTQRSVSLELDDLTLLGFDALPQDRSVTIP